MSQAATARLAAVGKAPEHAGGGREQPAVVVGAGRNIIRHELGVVAARHAVDVHGACIARLLDRGIELEGGCAFVVGVRLGDEFGQLLEDRGAGRSAGASPWNSAEGR